MKRKYSSNRELAHIWANDPDSSIEKSANSMSCQHGKLYSYYTVIAQIVGNNVIHNTASYSNSTSKHQSLARSASSHFDAIYLDVYKMGLSSLDSPLDFQDLILKPNLEKANQLLVKASRSKLYKDHLEGQAYSIFTNLEKYTKLLNIDWAMPNIEGLQASAIEADKKAKALAKIARAERIKQEAEDLALWKAGQDVRRYFDSTALRLKDDVIETSRGAKIPVEHAIKFWPFIKKWHDQGLEYTRDHHSIHLGNYTVTRFKGNILTVGCHDIPFSEIEAMAGQLRLS